MSVFFPLETAKSRLQGELRAGGSEPGGFELGG